MDRRADGTGNAARVGAYDGPTSHRFRTMHPLDPRVRTVWRLAAGLRFGALAVAAVAFDAARIFSDDRAVPLGLASGLVVAAAVLYLAAYVPRRYAAWRYVLDADALVLARGVVTRAETVVPVARVQHIDVLQGLIEREYGLARLVVHTAGTHDASVTLPGLALEDAEALRDTLRARAGDDDL